MNTNNNNKDVQRALNDVAIIKQVLGEKDQTNIDSRLSGVTLDANVIIQGGAFILTFLLCLYELMSGSEMTAIMMIEGQFQELSIFAIGFMAVALVSLLTMLYLILWRAAKHNGEDTGAYITRNFKYVKNLSLISDLLMKFIAVSLLMLAGKPEWVAPLLAAFTGDYLLQNRFFTLPTKLSSVLGIICIALGFWMFISGQNSLIVPLCAFALVAGISFVRLLTRYKTIGSLASQEQ